MSRQETIASTGRRGRRFVRYGIAPAAVVLLVGIVTMTARHTSGPKLMLTAGTDFAITTTISRSAAGSIPTMLYPGVQSYLVYTVSNPLTVPITVSALGITGVAAPGACPARNLDVSHTGFVGSLVVAAGSTNQTEVPIGLIDTATNQDACQNVTFNLTYSGTAAYTDAPPGGGPSTTAKPPVAPTRVAGVDRVLTAIAASQDGFGLSNGRAVVIARSDLYPDALAGTPLAVNKHAPLLLTAPTGLDVRTEREVQRVLPQGRTVYVLGGSAAISRVVVSRLNEDGYPVVRIGGTNRFSTAVAIARALGTPNDVLVGTGMSPADALAGGAAAAKLGGVVLLTDGATMPAETAAYLASKLGVARFALGGPAAAADPSATRLVGADRYATSVLVAQRFFGAPAVVGFANGFAFADALSGGADIAEKGGPLLLVAPDSLPASVHAYIHSMAQTLSGAYVYGGPSAIPNSELDQIGLALDGR